MHGQSEVLVRLTAATATATASAETQMMTDYSERVATTLFVPFDTKQIESHTISFICNQYKNHDSSSDCIKSEILRTVYNRMNLGQTMILNYYT